MPIAILENACVREQVISISVNQYHKMNELGIIPEKTELVDGVVLEKMSKSPLHSYIVFLLNDFFAKHLSEMYIVRKEEPLTFKHSEPEPDIAIVKGQMKDFKTAHPNHAELVIEVAISSLKLDRAKSDVYALAEIPEYWVVIPTKKQIEVYTIPDNGRYKVVQIYRQTDKIEVMRDLILDLGKIFDLCD
ncbi:Uma2 family endonuclease [Candidatus Parabeggiatoa sp. HSG14]|uniref:Uma2 family endonuclease n=1 Tax=Candidatus Parabeggiatoa sp. HSG14 TaxID=3055593 RepID=UPI0025A7530C|nr:Uma2 family endonuclease [Thiotrichales bacterium HSG14]